ncbi:MAG: caspase domain-containing protein [Elusimicrobiota bacterium]
MKRVLLTLSLLGIASAAAFARRPIPKPRPIADPAQFLRRWDPPPLPEEKPAAAATAAAVDHGAFAADAAKNFGAELSPRHYYWHHEDGSDYVHYYASGAHWYGFYSGSKFYWLQYHAGRWWWYDPAAKRCVYYEGGYWWWQDPDAPKTLYVFLKEAYVPYEAFAAAVTDTTKHIVFYSATSDGADAPATPGSITSAGPKYSSDVDEPVYSAASDPNRFALVVGVEDYAGLPPAQFAARDAAAVRAHLSALGYPDRNVVVLTSSQAARASVAKYVESWLPERVKAESTVFVYFSGHGAPDPKTGTAYLMPWDGDAKYLATTGYPLKQLYAKLNGLPAKNIVVVLDSCFSGLGGRSVLVAGARPLVGETDADQRGVGKLLVFTAAGADEITGALPGEGHGLFTYYFLKGLNGGAPLTPDGVTAQGLFDYLSPKVADAARRENRDQTARLFVPPGMKSATLIRPLR